MRIGEWQKSSSYWILSIIAVLFVLPLLWIIFASFDPHATQVIKLPEDPSWDNYIFVITDPVIQKAFFVGIFISGSVTIVVVLLSLLAAYPLSRFPMKNKQKIMMSILFLTSLPITAIMVPVYQLFIFLNLQDSILGTILFMTASQLPFGIWITKNFIDSVSVELEESAWIDGASLLTGLGKVVVPLMLPGLFTVSIFVFISSWGNFFVPYILLQSPEKFPASVTIYEFFGQYGYVAYGKLAAYSVLYMLPSFILYYLAQNHMSKGFAMSGATKG